MWDIVLCYSYFWLFRSASWCLNHWYTTLTVRFHSISWSRPVDSFLLGCAGQFHVQSIDHVFNVIQPTLQGHPIGRIIIMCLGNGRYKIHLKIQESSPANNEQERMNLLSSATLRSFETRSEHKFNLTKWSWQCYNPIHWIFLYWGGVFLRVIWHWSENWIQNGEWWNKSPTTLALEQILHRRDSHWGRASKNGLKSQRVCGEVGSYWCIPSCSFKGFKSLSGHEQMWRVWTHTCPKINMWTIFLRTGQVCGCLTAGRSVVSDANGISEKKW